MSLYAISELDDPEQIREYLYGDEAYAAYALADLEPPHAAHSRWFAAAQTGQIDGLALVYDEMEPTILFLMGDRPALSALLMSGIGPGSVFFTAPADMADALPDFYNVTESMGMFRMRITRGIFNPYVDTGTASGGIILLGPQDAPDVSELIDLTSDADGRDRRDVYFTQDMLLDGYYRGIRLDNTLVAVAGTHIAARTAGVAAVGNVVVHPEQRRRGFGGLVSQAVTEALLTDGYELVVLNVRQNNAPANKIYRRLGYKQVAAFVEGYAERH